MDERSVDQTGRQGEAVAKVKADALTDAAVLTYLRRNPDFLVRHPDIAGVLIPPVRAMGEGVVDLQQFIVQKLRSDISRLKLNQRKLIATSRNNLVSQGRVHAAIIALIGARSFEDFITVLTDELASLLDVDAVGFCLEASGEGTVAANSNVRILPVGMIDQLLGSEAVVLRADISGEPEIYGEELAGLARSDALIRLHVSSQAPAALLALGARRPGIFHPGQGTELIGFLAETVEITTRAWLDLDE
ncbi:DUF484 family protein [Elstera sp.]|jgi:uncharacterized protein YigA (DUF484 family)|uniref:DUF484 family protein n=1 Tax=Elstera sp. TaxID=1916664 RepID=UPI0037BF27D1